MRSRFVRHLQVVLRSGAEQAAKRAPIPRARAVAPDDARPPISPEFDGHQYAVFLLRVAAGIEHALMAQYLYAAYSLGGPGVAERDRRTVAGWQETILGIAKEEMGHLITVQNVLRLVAGPISFDREDYPFDAAFYPFDFTLEALTRASLAKYVYAEKPPDWSGPLADEVTKLATEANHEVVPNAVSKLYELMIETLADPTLVPDRAFHADTRDLQASWNEWGRGYAHGARGNATGDGAPGTPDLIIRTMASRAEAVAALRAIAEQGEATTEAGPEPSHFERFLAIYEDWKRLEAEPDFRPSRPVATNPVVEDSLADAAPRDKCTVITDPVAFYWAHLLNVRYRLLLSGLTHVFQSVDPYSAAAQPTARSELVTLVFGEMYKLRGLGMVLVELPAARGGDPARAAAGAPFEMPYTVMIPLREVDRWRWHLDMLIASRGILDELATLDHDPGRRGFAAAIRDGDGSLIHQIERIIAGLDAADTDGAAGATGARAGATA
jgi:hypothetical protein